MQHQPAITAVPTPKTKPAAETSNTNQPSQPQFDCLLRNAEHLLEHAVEAGIDVDQDTTKIILTSITKGHSVWDNPEAAELAAAITKLAAKLKPVTAETLRASREDAHQAIRGYKRIALILAAFIGPLSILSFMSAGISNKIKADVTAANEYVLTLHTQVDTSKLPGQEAPSPVILREMQNFAIAMRSVLGHSKQLSWITFIPEEYPCADRQPCQLELAPENLKTLEALQKQLDETTTTYQKIRNYANAVTTNATLVWGAIGNIILPVLYALLGACAAVLRAFTQQLGARTFAPTYATPARFYIAGIGGGVIGLFNNVFGEHASVSPLALAFLVGYATDIFFSFLEGTTQTFAKAKLNG
jgi:hypothetical protein